MKKTILCAVALMSLLVCAVVTVKTVQKSNDLVAMISGDVEALTYSNELPAPGESQPQAVWCCGGGWKIREGCCYGAGSCYKIYCGEIVCFSCDGNSWWGY